MRIEVPDDTDKHRCQYARDVIRQRTEFTDQLADDMVIHYFAPEIETDSGTIYEMKARIIFEYGDADE